MISGNYDANWPADYIFGLIEEDPTQSPGALGLRLKTGAAGLVWLAWHKAGKAWVSYQGFGGQWVAIEDLSRDAGGYIDDNRFPATQPDPTLAARLAAWIRRNSYKAPTDAAREFGLLWSIVVELADDAGLSWVYPDRDALEEGRWLELEFCDPGGATFDGRPLATPTDTPPED